MYPVHPEHAHAASAPSPEVEQRGWVVEYAHPMYNPLPPLTISAVPTELYTTAYFSVNVQLPFFFEATLGMIDAYTQTHSELCATEVRSAPGRVCELRARLLKPSERRRTGYQSFYFRLAVQHPSGGRQTGEEVIVLRSPTFIVKRRRPVPKAAPLVPDDMDGLASRKRRRTESVGATSCRPVPVSPALNAAFAAANALTLDELRVLVENLAAFLTVKSASAAVSSDIHLYCFTPASTTDQGSPSCGLEQDVPHPSIPIVHPYPHHLPHPSSADHGCASSSLSLPSCAPQVVFAPHHAPAGPSGSCSTLTGGCARALHNSDAHAQSCGAVGGVVCGESRVMVSSSLSPSSDIELAYSLASPFASSASFVPPRQSAGAVSASVCVASDAPHHPAVRLTRVNDATLPAAAAASCAALGSSTRMYAETTGTLDELLGDSHDAYQRDDHDDMGWESDAGTIDECWSPRHDIDGSRYCRT